MASAKEIRIRLTSVKNTRQITRAMKMVAAAKLRQAQDAIISARPFSIKIEEVLKDLAWSESDSPVHPLLQGRPVRKVLLVVLTSDRGLCGGFNSSIIKSTEVALAETKKRAEAVSVAFIGRKAHQYFKNRDISIYKNYSEVMSNVTFAVAKEIADELMGLYLDGTFDEIRFIYNEFKSAIAQDVVSKQFLPIQFPHVSPNQSGLESKVDFLYEPNKQDIFKLLLPRHFHTQVHRSLLESLASEHGARMSAMEAATKNAGEMIKALTLAYNRLRQGAITNELIEIVSGAEAL